MPKKIHRDRWLLGLILFFGLGLRLIGVNQSLWLDEAISVAAAANYSLTELFINFLPHDFNPPLYYLILHFWLKIFPRTELFIRLPSIIFALLTCWLVYKLFILVFKDRKGGLISAMILASSPLHLYYSQEARAYSLNAFLAAASIYWFIKLLQARSWHSLFAYSLITSSMIYCHYLCWLLLAMQWFYFFLSRAWKSKKSILSFGFSQGIIFLLWLPFSAVFLKQLKAGAGVGGASSVWGKVLGGPSLKNISLIAIKFIIGRTSFGNKAFYFSLSTGLILFFGYLLWQSYQKCKKEFTPGVNLIWLWVGGPVVIGWVISFKIPLFSYFRFLFCLPAFYLLISDGMLRSKKREIFLAIVLLVNFFFSFRYLFNQDFHREDWQRAVAVLHQKNQGLDPVLIKQNVSAPFDYYDKGKSRRIFIYQKQAIAGFDSVWLIPYALPIFDPEDETRKFLENSGYVRVYEEHFRGVTLEKWEKLFADVAIMEQG